MARFKLFERRGHDARHAEEAEPAVEVTSTDAEGDVQAIGTKYTTLSGEGDTAGFGPGEPPQGRESWIEVIAAAREGPDVTGEQPDALSWQGLVENQAVVAPTAGPNGFQALTKNEKFADTDLDDGPSNFVAADPDNGDASLVFQKIEPESLQVELMFDGISHSDDWQAPDV